MRVSLRSGRAAQLSLSVVLGLVLLIGVLLLVGGGKSVLAQTSPVADFADQTPWIVARYAMDGFNDVFGGDAIPGNTILITVTDQNQQVVTTGSTEAGSCDWCGDNGYVYAFPDGAFPWDRWVTVDFGDGITDSLQVVEITGDPQVDSELVIGTAPANGSLSAFVEDGIGGRAELNGVTVDATGVYTFDFGSVGWDIQVGDSIHVYYAAGENKAVEYYFWIPYPELQIEKQSTPGEVLPGGTYLYRIAYWNNGNGEAEDTVITDTLPDSMTYATDTSGFGVLDDGSVITWTLGTLPPNSYGEFFVALAVDGGVSPDTQLDDNCIGIATASIGDPNPDNNWSCAGGPYVVDAETGVGVDKWPVFSDPTPGQEFSYDINYWSDGSAATGPIWMTDTLPANTSFVSWEEQWGWGSLWTDVVTTAETVAFYAPAGIPGNMGGQIRVTLKLDELAAMGALLENHLVAATPIDNNLDDNQDTDTSAYVSAPRYDLQLNKSMHHAVLVPEGWINYFVWYGNQGNTATHVWVTDTVPPGLTFEGAFWGGGQPGDGEPLPDPTIVGDQIVWDLGVLPVNGSRWFHIDMSISDELDPDDEVTNCAQASPEGEDQSPADNIGCTTVRLNPTGPNLRVVKEHWWNGDSQLGYNIRFYNVGDEAANDVWITDTLPVDTHWDGWWNLQELPWERITETSLTSDVLAWHFTTLDPGEAGNLEFNADLDYGGTPLRWYTNTAEIALLPGDPDPSDNVFEDVAFSGGEVQWVDIDVGRTRIWACGPSGPLTVISKDGETTFPDSCFDADVGTGFMPGDIVTVTGGMGQHPVIIDIPEPFVSAASSITDTVWGQVDHLDHEQIQVDVWGIASRYGETDGDGHFSVTYPDVPRGAAGDILYSTEIDYAQVGLHGRFGTPDLLLQVNESDDWIEGDYEPGHTLLITVTDSGGSVIGVAELETGEVPWWGGNTGFSTNWQGWQGEQPDIQPGGWVYATLDNGYTSTVHVGSVTGSVDAAADAIEGTIDAEEISQPVPVRCESWGDYGAPNPQSKYDTILPDGSDMYHCVWDPASEWDVLPGQEVAVRYAEPDGDQVIAVFEEPAPYLRIQKGLDGASVGEGGNASFWLAYRNEGGADAESVVITDTLEGMSYITDTSGLAHTLNGDQVIWNLGTVKPGDWIRFDVFAEVTASAGEQVTNTADIATTNPYDMGEPDDKHAEWPGVVQPNDARLNVGVGSWTGDPAPGQDVVFWVNLCNSGDTASTEVVLTNTLHPSLTLQLWWGQHAGWIERSSTAQELVLARPTLAQGWCSEVYIRARVDGDAWPGMDIWDHALVFAADDLTDDDNESQWDGQVGSPHANLGINKSFGSGQLVPGGEVRYWVGPYNNGNLPAGTVRVTETLPVSTTFQAAYHYDDYGPHEFLPAFLSDSEVAWEWAGLDNGYGDNFEVVLDIDPDAEPGTVLTNLAEISQLPSEDDYNDNLAAWTEVVYPHGPNLRISKSGWWDDWGAGDEHAGYQLTIENVGDAWVSNVAVTDTLPVGLRLDGDVWGDYWEPWDWHDLGHALTVTLQELGPGWTTHLNFGAMTDTQPLPFGMVFTNTAEVMLVAGDTNPADNYVDDAVLRTGPDLWVWKDLSDGELKPGELVTFTLAFGNSQPGHMWWWGLQGNAVLTDTLPAGLEYVSAQLHWCGWTDWCDRDPDAQEDGTLTWNLWPITTGEWNEIVVTLRITDTATGLDSFGNEAEIASSEPGLDIEPYLGNNHSGATFGIDLPFFEVTKAYASTGVAGMPVTYTLTVTNTGNSLATGVQLTDTLPTGVGYTSSDGAYAAGVVTWDLGTLTALGGNADGWFSGVLPCTLGPVTNDTYGVGSDQGVTALGPPVALAVVAPSLSADIDPSATTIVAGEPIDFTDGGSTNGRPVAARLWDFGDGDTSTALSPTHTYTTDGQFSVTLVVTDECGFTDVETQTITVVAPDLVAGFDQSATAVVVGTTVDFNDTSTTNGPAIASWGWDFGDGDASAVENPSHTYTTVGIFTVQLTVTDTLGYTDVATSTVSVTPACTPVTSVDFVYGPSDPFIHDTVVFTGSATPLSATGPLTYTWTFGDGTGTTVVAATISHVYTSTGQMTVRMKVVNPCTPGGVTRQKVLTISPHAVYLPLTVRAAP